MFDVFIVCNMRAGGGKLQSWVSRAVYACSCTLY